MKHRSFLLILIVLLSLCGCNKKEKQITGIKIPEKGEGTSSAKLTFVKDITDKRIGVMLGTVHDNYARKNYPDAEILQYHTVPDMIMALMSEKVDVAIIGNVTLKEILKRNDKIGILENNIYSNPLGIGFNKENTVLKNQFNVFLNEIKTNGIYDDLVNRWMNNSIYKMPQIETTGKNGTLTVGVVSSLGVPFSGIENGKNTGFDIELSKRFAAYIGKEFEPVDLVFSSMLASLKTNKIDMAACSMMITEERQKQISFSDPYYSAYACIIALKKNMPAFNTGEEKQVNKSILKTISESFYNNIILENRYLLIIDGLKLTILISFFSAIVGTIIGGIVCSLRMSRRKILSVTARFYITILRGTPVLVLLMIIYYVVFASVNISPVFVSVFAFGLNFGAYVSEMFRTSIESIDKGQKEAGIAGGFTKIQTFIHIILPQAIHHVLPVYKGEFISLVKMTSIVGYIAVQDLTKASDIIRSRTFDAFFPLLVAAVFYLILAWLLTWALDRLEVSVDPKRRHLTKAKEVSKR
ncbi:MAG: ABC transporter substrate-binding protein/permease [Bacteroidetes bacterium]|nr:ABC transporter substrate-binding protein/permease [Bacteroidota bacterium]